MVNKKILVTSFLIFFAKFSFAAMPALPKLPSLPPALEPKIVPAQEASPVVIVAAPKVSLPVDVPKQVASLEPIKDISKENDKPLSLRVKDDYEKYGLRGNAILKKFYLIKTLENREAISEAYKAIVNLKEKSFSPKIEEIDAAFETFNLSRGSKGKDFSAQLIELQSQADELSSKIMDQEQQPDSPANQDQSIRYKFFKMEEDLALFKEKLFKLKIEKDFVDDLKKNFRKKVDAVELSLNKAEELLDSANSKVADAAKTIDEKKTQKIYFFTNGLIDNSNIIKTYLDNLLKDFSNDISPLQEALDKNKKEAEEMKNSVQKMQADMLALEKSLALTGAPA